jgi:DNA-binding transcriptional ArsR family regulator
MDLRVKEIFSMSTVSINIHKTGYPSLRKSTPAERKQAAGLFKILSHPHRLQLACRVGELGVTTQRDLIRDLGWPQSTVARHLSDLRRAGLVDAERDGAEVLLTLGDPIGLHLLDAVCRWLHGEEITPSEEGNSYD